MQKTFIKRLIEEEVNRLLEQDKPPKADDAKPDDTTADTGGDLGGDDTAAADAAGGDTGDLGADIGGAVGGGSGGGLGGDAGDLGTDADVGDDADAGTEMPTSSGGFGGTKSFDFGSSGSKGVVPDDGDSDDSNDSGPDSGKEKDKATTIGPEDVEAPIDPVMTIVDDAIKLLDVTQAPQDILKNVKYAIQQYFNNFDEATPVIKALWDTENVVLRDVAKRLLIFMRGN